MTLLLPPATETMTSGLQRPMFRQMISGFMRRVFLPLFLAVILAGCEVDPRSVGGSPSSDRGLAQSGRMTLMQIAPLTAKNASEIPGIVRRFQAADPDGNRRVWVNDVDLFLTSSIGKSFINGATPKALAIGTPPENCPWYQVSSGSSAAGAVRSVLGKCLDGLSRAATGREPCACRVVAVNRSLLVKPSDLPFRPRLPAHLIWVDARGDVRRQVVFADLADSGSARPVNLATADGRSLCSGKLDDLALPRADVSLDCDGIGGGLTGRLNIEGFREGRIYGIADLQSGATRAALFLGYSEAQYRATRETVIARALKG